MAGDVWNGVTDDRREIDRDFTIIRDLGAQNCAFLRPIGCLISLQPAQRRSNCSSGPFLARVRFPDRIDTPPHRHEAPFIDRNTVISGTLFVGIGETFDKTKGIAVPPGGVVAIPLGVAHFAWSEEETVVHVRGEGPWLPTT